MVRRDRGQLILVGAIAIAMILLGLVLIVNTALFTQVVGSEGTVESTKQAGTTIQEAGDAIAAIAAQENLKNDSKTQIIDRIDDKTEDDLDPIFVKRTVESSGSYTSIDFLGEAAAGRSIVQDSSAPIGDWGPVVDDGDVGHFMLVVDTGSSAGNQMEIDVDPAGPPAPKTLQVTVNGAGDEVVLTGAGSASCSGIQETDGTVRIDLKHGSVYEDGSCQFDLFGNGTEEYTVSFDGGGDVTGTYAIVTDDTSSITAPGRVAVSYAVWEINYEVRYASKSVTSYNVHREVEVYD